MSEEINLLDFIKVFFRRKWIIIGVALGIIGLSVFSALTAPKEYSGSIMIETGRMSIFRNGTSYAFVPESIVGMQEKINNGLYTDYFEKDVDAGKISKVEAFFSKENKETNLLSIMVTSSDSEEGLKYLQELQKVIVSQNKLALNKKVAYLNKTIAMEKARADALEKSPNLTSLQYVYIDHLNAIEEARMSINTAEPASVAKSAPEKLSSKSNLKMNVFVSVVLGLLLGTAVAFVIDFWQSNKDFLKR
jgi:uncharacterized protein involved in exopolysaccharide biosynthesis